jgi:hypothetical protein
MARVFELRNRKRPAASFLHEMCSRAGAAGGRIIGDAPPAVRTAFPAKKSKKVVFQKAMYLEGLPGTRAGTAET